MRCRGISSLWRVLPILGFFVAVAWTASVAHAQAGQGGPAKRSSTDEVRRAEAAELTEQAQRAYLEGDFRRALDGYHEAYQRHPAPELLFNLGQCHRRLGQHDRAALFFDLYLQARPKADHRDLVESLRRESLGHARRDILHVDPDDEPERVGDRPEVALRVGGAEQTSEREERLSPRKRRFVWAAAVVATVASVGTAVALTRDGNREPAGDEGHSTLGIVDWR